MIQPTREELINFMKKHGAENVDSITDEQSAIRHFRAQSKVLVCQQFFRQFSCVDF
ncbi:hypothetical protein NNI65_13895 [Staphylococcus aureus]|nr:hypothetical protein [Staphylococcus aureus]